MPIAVLGRSNLDGGALAQVFNSLSQSASPLDSVGITYVEHWPKPPTPTIPEHLPPSVEKAFSQAEGNFPREGYEESAGMMYRRSLELGLSEKYPDLKGSLAARIAQLVKDHVLTRDLGDWATEVRLVGNDAAHADEVTRDDLEMMRAFADAVLRYVWTLPTQVHLRRAARAAPPVEPQPSEQAAAQ